jgi:methionine-rich copper-binding protein CopC
MRICLRSGGGKLTEMRRRPMLTALALLMMGALISPAAAQGPQPTKSDPEPGEKLEQPATRVRITFDAPLRSSSDLAAFDPCGKRVSGETTVIDRTMFVPIEGRSSGHYTVRYSADAGGDSPVIGGTFSFHVRNGPRCEEEGHGHEGQGRHAAQGGQRNQKGKLLKADDGSFLSDRMSPQMSLVLVLLIAASAGLLGGLALRRRFQS